MTEEIKYMPIQEFVDEGYLQEINRVLLHPCGLALAIHSSDTDSTTMRIWDYRDDPEGMIFGQGVISQDKINKVEDERHKHVKARLEFFGSVIQWPETAVPMVEDSNG